MAGVRRLDVLLVVYALGLLVTAVSAGARCGRRARPSRRGRGAPPRDAARELAIVGGTLQVTHLVAQAGDQGLRVVLGSAFGAAAIGLYDLASRAAIAPRSLMASLLVALVPFAAAREDRDGLAALSDSLQRSTRYAALAIAAGTIVGLFVAGAVHDAVARHGGRGPRRRHRILELLLVALAVQSMTSPMVALARAAGRAGPEAVSTSLAQPLALAVAAHASTLVLAVAATPSSRPRRAWCCGPG